MLRPGVLVQGSLAVLLLAQWADEAWAQGRDEYFNVESPVVHPMEVVTVNDHDFLLVCNPPDNSLEVYDADPVTPLFMQRVPVGLEPVSVKTHTVSGELRFYTANYLGDSVTMGRIESGDGGTVRLVVLETQNVGDGPTDLEFYDYTPNVTAILISHSEDSSYGFVNAANLTTFGQTPPSFDLALNFANPFTAESETWVLNEPRVIRIRGNSAYFLGFKGGDWRNSGSPTANPAYPWNYDLDLMIADLRRNGIQNPPLIDQCIPQAYSTLPGIASTNWNMRFADNGDLYLVGGEAQNFGDETEHDNLEQVREEEISGSGIVTSLLTRLAGPLSGSTPVDRTNNQVDLNRVSSVPVGPGSELAMPTDLALAENAQGVQRVFVTAYGSDRLGVYERPTGSSNLDLATWNRSTIEYVFPSQKALTPRRGPRALLTHTPSAGPTRLYCFNRFDLSVSVFDADTAPYPEISTVELDNDPTPDHIVRGRHHLYAATRFTSCASCHTDGRTDALAWRLGDVAGRDPAPATDEILNLFGAPVNLFQWRQFILAQFNNFFSGRPIDDKREMTTQSLQGLMNQEVDLGAAKDQLKQLFTTAPFHWRGDRKSFQSFNEAFVGLLAREDKLLQTEIEEFEDFIFSISYPPNPQQARERVYDALAPAPNARTGLQLFHEESLPVDCNGKSCAQCHSLPTGSNHFVTFTVAFGEEDGYSARSGNHQILETAELRGLFQREGLLQRSGLDSSDPGIALRKNHFGLTHIGTVNNTLNRPISINSFVDVFEPDLAILSERQAISQFVHEFDWGVAPMVGRSITVTPGNRAATAADVDGLEEQARLANSGLVVQIQTQVGSAIVRRGFWYLPTLGAYFEEVAPAVIFADRDALLDAVLGPLEGPDQATFHAVPLGSERRIASTTGAKAQGNVELTPSPPLLQPLAPNTAYKDVPTFQGNVVPPLADLVLNLGGAGIFTVEDAPFVRMIRNFQTSLMDNPIYGIAAGQLRHECSRRLRVASRRLIPGAKLHVHRPDPTLVGPGENPQTWNTNWVPGQPGADPDNILGKTIQLTVPIHPTASTTPAGVPIWESSVELDPMTYYLFMVGGPQAPRVDAATSETVQDALDWMRLKSLTLLGNGRPNPAEVIEPVPTELFAPGNNPFDPDRWNWMLIQVENPSETGGSSGPIRNAGGMQQLVLSAPGS